MITSPKEILLWRARASLAPIRKFCPDYQSISYDEICVDRAWCFACANTDRARELRVSPTTRSRDVGSNMRVLYFAKLLSNKITITVYS